MSVADTIRSVGREGADSGDPTDVDEMDIIEFIESPAGLQFSTECGNQSLYPVQKFILKAFYNLPLDDEDAYIRIPKSWRFAQSDDPSRYYEFTELEYMDYLYQNGRCNIKAPDHPRKELVLVLGRRSGKSLMSSMIAAYETYRLLRKGDPQTFYGMPEGDRIQICSVATTTDQAGILYNNVRRHYNTCDFYKQYLSKNTQKYVQFQTPHDLQMTGPADEGGNESIRVTFYSSSSSGIRGPSNIAVIMDEVAFFKTSGQTSASKVYEAVTPSVAEFSPKDPDTGQPLGDSEGRILLISSPNAKEGLFYEKYAMARSGGPGSEDLLMFQCPTWEVNPTLSNKYFKKEHAKDPEAFSKEFGAQFSESRQAWIDTRDDLQCCISPDLEPETSGYPRDPHYLGLDLGLKNDRTAAVLTKPEGDHVRMVYHEQWQAGTPWRSVNPHLEKPMMEYAAKLGQVGTLDLDEIAKWIFQLSKRFYIEKGVFDQFQGISFEQTIHKMGLKSVEMKNFKPQEKRDMFQAFKTLMFHEKLQLYDYEYGQSQSKDQQFDDSFEEGDDHAPYIQELLDLESVRTSRRLNVEAPDVPGKFDDFSDAIVRSVWLSYQQVRDPDDAEDHTQPITTGTNPTGGGGHGRVGQRQSPSFYDSRHFQRVKRQRHNYHSNRDPSS